jgi:integrase
MQILKYHVFRKPRRLKNKKIVRRWYYYWVDETGKKIQKSCGTKVKNREQAEDFIRTLPQPAPAVIPNKADAVKRLHTLPLKNPDILVEDIAKNMFLPGSAHIQRRAQLKKSVTEESMITNRVFMKHIIATWGKRMLRSLELDEIMNYLFSVDRSASWKNQYISNLNEIYQEGQFMGCKVYKPDFPSIGKIENKADIFTQDDLERFFKPDNFTHDFFFLFFLCSLSGGLRLGETRGLMARQIIFDKKAVIIDGYLKSNGTRTVYNKKGTPEHPKLRVVPYPDLTLNLLKAIIEKNNIGPTDFVFTYNEHPIKKTMAETAFKLALVNAGIARSKDELIKMGFWQKGHIQCSADELTPDGRRLIPHSLRFTYITRMSREMDAHTLKKLTCHDSAAMVDYYNRKNLEMALASIPCADAATNSLLPQAIGNT